MTQPRIDFYILNQGGTQGRLSLFAKLCEKIYKEKLPCYIHCENSVVVEELDTFLWTFQDILFIPHSTVDSKVANSTSILLGHSSLKSEMEPQAKKTALLINMAEAVPEFYKQFARILEIIPSQEPHRQQGRIRFQHYKNEGFSINTHKL